MWQAGLELVSNTFTNYGDTETDIFAHIAQFLADLRSGEKVDNITIAPCKGVLLLDKYHLEWYNIIKE